MSGRNCKDIICGTLTVKGKQIIASNGEITTNKLTVKEDLVVNGSLMVDGVDSSIATSSCLIQPPASSDSIMIDRPMLFNRHGIVKVGLLDKVEIDEDDKIILTPAEWEWEILIESFPGSPSLALQNDSLFQAPAADAYVNDCMPENWKMIVEVNIHLSYVTSNYEDDDVIQLSLLLNKDVNDPDDNEGIISSSFMSINNPGFFRFNSIDLHDIVLLSPEDTLDIFIRTESSDGEVIFASGLFDEFVENPTNVAYATFKILGFQESL